jgi:predicted signal transduction protein with EAL and GGDEF domain
VAGRLIGNVRESDTVSRLGGDEFVIMLTDIDAVSRVTHIAESLLRAITKPYHIDAFELHVTASIGISIFPDDGTTIETLIKNADMAMYHAKESGRNSYQFFSAAMNLRNSERARLESSLKRALEHREFVLQYQPELDVNSGRTVGAEALIRWQHPEFGLLQPEQFIALSEECGMIIPIGNWVLRTACLQARAWLDQGAPMIVSVNLSVAQFRQKDLLKSIVEAMEYAGIGPQYLELEITESVLMDGASRAIETLKELRRIGISLAIDDFGTGYSSLSYLKHISIDKLKIDQSFLLDITTPGDDSAIVVAIIAMAKSLHLKVIAEGVETVEQLNFLQAHGCDVYQGFYSSHALAPDELAKFRSGH